MTPSNREVICLDLSLILTPRAHVPYLDGRLVGLYFAYRIELLDARSGLYEPLDNLTLGDTWTQH
jgi:hypothetical protein